MHGPQPCERAYGRGELQTCFHCKHGRSLTWCTVLLFCPQLQQGVSCSQLSLDRPWHLDRVSWFYEYSHVAFDECWGCVLVFFFSRRFNSILVISAVPSSVVGLCFVVVIDFIWFSNQKTFVGCDMFVAGRSANTDYICPISFVHFWLDVNSVSASHRCLAAPAITLASWQWLLVDVSHPLPVLADLRTIWCQKHNKRYLQWDISQWITNIQAYLRGAGPVRLWKF